MKNKITLLAFFFLFTNCTQNLISYIKTPHSTPIVSAEDIFLKSGLIDPITIDQKPVVTQNQYPTGTLTPPRQQLTQIFNTLQVPQNSAFTINIDTKNHLNAIPYYSSEGIIYQADQSLPKQGKFVFETSALAGEIRIRIYNENGILHKESIWYIESQQ